MFIRFFSRWLCLLTVLLSPCLLSGENAAAGKQKKIPLRLPSMPDPRNTTPDAAVELAVLREFKRRFPCAELSSFSGITIPGIGSESKLMLAIAGGNAPDVMPINFRMSDTYIQQCFLYPLDDFVHRDFPGSDREEYLFTDGNGTKITAPGYLREYLQGLPAPLHPVIYRKGPAVGRIHGGYHLWTISNNLVVRVLMWRKDLFADAGLDPEKPPQNWEELVEFAKRITDPSKKRYGIRLATDIQASWDFMSFLWSAGGEAVVQDKDGSWRAAFDTDAAALALDYYVRLSTEEWIDADGNRRKGYSVSSADTSGANAWNEGRCGMTMSYLGNMKSNSVDPALVGIASFPPGPGQKIGRGEFNASLYGIFSDIQGRKNSEGEYVSAEEIRELAWQYVKFLSSQDAERIYVDVMVERNMAKYIAPSRLKKFGKEAILEELGDNNSSRMEEVFRNAVLNGRPEPYGRNCQMVYVYMTQPLDEALQLARDGKLPVSRMQRLRVLKNILRDAVETTNVRMIGKLSREERTRQNRIAGVVAILILALVCFVMYNIWKVFSPKDSYSGKNRGWEFRKNWPAYLMMLPAAASILLWVYFPMFSGSRLAFLDYRFTGESAWVGLNNFADVLFSREWWNAILTTLRYMLLMLTFGFVSPIVLAILLQEVSHAKIFYRTVYYLPAVMSGLVVMYLWRLFYQDGSSGILNQIFASLFGLFGMDFEPQSWLNDPKWALIACVLPTIWAGAGPGCLIYLAALKGIPDETYEAADIDGANFFRKLWSITLPSLKSLIIINFVGAFIHAAQSGGMILVMTYGRANTEVAELQIFKEAYTNLRFGSAIAMAWLLGAMTIMFTVVQLRKLSRMEFRTTGKS